MSDAEVIAGSCVVSANGHGARLEDFAVVEGAVVPADSLTRLAEDRVATCAFVRGTALFCGQDGSQRLLDALRLAGARVRREGEQSYHDHSLVGPAAIRGRAAYYSATFRDRATLEAFLRSWDRWAA